MSTESRPSSTREQALALLAQRVPAAQVASSCGVTESAISQLLSDEDFSAALAEKMQAATAEDLKYDERLAAVESGFLANIEKRLEFANLQQSLQAFRILNQAKRRKESRIQAPQGGGIAVTINLPASILPQYVKNHNAEIIEVDGRTMLSATPSTVDQLMKQRVEAAGRSMPETSHVGLTKVERAQNGLRQLSPAESEGLPTAESARKPARALRQREPINIADLL